MEDIICIVCLACDCLGGVAGVLAGVMKAIDEPEDLVSADTWFVSSLPLALFVAGTDSFR